MMDDYRVKGRSTKEIEAVTLAWRDKLGAPNDWAPNMLRLLGIEKYPNCQSSANFLSCRGPIMRWQTRKPTLNSTRLISLFEILSTSWHADEMVAVE